jgi:SAM-dependent methyltransferase
MPIIETIQVDNCALCHASGQNVYVKLVDRLHDVSGQWDYALCGECELLWLRNRPRSEHVATLYSSYYSHKTPERPALSTAPSIQRSIKRNVVQLGLVDILDAPTYWRELWYGDQGKARFLDVGCGNGEFAGILQSAGWEVAGVEPDEAAAAIPSQYLGVAVHVGYLDTVGFDDGEFDLIRLSHVLEHLDDPVQALARCYRLLRPGGRLLISTPNLNSLGHQHRFADNWLHLDPPRHFFLFSPRSLEQAARAAGFEDVAISTSARGARMTWLTSATIARCGKLPLEWKQGISFAQRVEAETFAAIEAVVCRFAPLAEDLQLIAIR